MNWPAGDYAIIETPAGRATTCRSTRAPPGPSGRATSWRSRAGRSGPALRSGVPAAQRVVVRKVPLDLAEQVHYRGPVLLDQLASQPLAPYGFGADVRRAVGRRADALRALGIDPDDPARLTKLRELERHALGQGFAARSGHPSSSSPRPTSKEGWSSGTAVPTGPPTPSSPTGRGSPWSRPPRPPRARRTGGVAQAGSRRQAARARSRQRPRSLTARAPCTCTSLGTIASVDLKSARACTDRTHASAGSLRRVTYETSFPCLDGGARRRRLVRVTQYVAGELRHDPQLGPAWVVVGDTTLYPPGAWIGWSDRYGRARPTVFRNASAISTLAALLGVVVVAIASSQRRRTGRALPRQLPLGDDARDRKRGACFATRGSSSARRAMPSSERPSGGTERSRRPCDASGALFATTVQSTCSVSPHPQRQRRRPRHPDAALWPHSVLVYDIKKENWALTAGWRRQFSHVWRFRADGPDSVRFNPLLEIRRGLQEVKDAQNVADILVDPTGEKETRTTGRRARIRSSWARSCTSSTLTGTRPSLAYPRSCPIRLGPKQKP